MVVAVALVASLFGVAACSKPSFGPPQLLRVERGGETVEFAVATWTTEDLALVVPGLASALSGVAVRCGGEAERSVLECAVVDGLLRPRTGEGGCLADGLAGARVGPSGATMHLRIQARPGGGVRR